MPLLPGSRRLRDALDADSSRDSADIRDSYEEVPYPGSAFPQTHPDRLATIATLFGGRPAPVATCRVLELGCGDGANLVPLAYVLPGATFVGLDLSPRAIAQARAAADELGLRNLEFVSGDLAEADPARLGRFDAVIAHGVFSWVPEPVREALLTLTRNCLEREGAAFLSFNALPGAHLRAVLREGMRWHARGARTPAERIAAARAMTARMAPRAGESGPLRRQVQHALERDEAGILHDELAEPNDAFLVTEVAARAARHGLRLLAEAELHEGVDGVAPEVARELDELGGDRLAREQYLDLLNLRAYRQAVLVRDDAATGAEPRPAGLDGLRAAAQLTPTAGKRGVVRFEAAKGGAVSTDHPDVQAALRILGERWPASVPVAELPGDEGLRAALLSAHLRGVVELRSWEPPLAEHVPLRPMAPAPARRQAALGDNVTTLRHTTVQLDEAGRRLLELCDGSRDLTALGEALALDERGRRELRGQLERLAALALIQA